MSTGFHPPVEEYLEAIYSLTEEGVDVIQARLVERLGHSPQAVSEMVGRLSSDGYVERSKRAVTLTDKGEEKARTIVRRHRLAERFLVDIVGLPWDRAHIEAGKWEHVISDEVEVRFVELLGNPTTCPHGSPIPGSGAVLGPQVAFAEVEPGQMVHIRRITEQIETDEKALSFCSVHGLVPGTVASVAERGPDGSLSVTLEHDGRETETLALGPAFSRHIFVSID